eukprot:TRINITY_DN108969_c0_g1_i1.p1 TRINITY_DN108969_c0_g1~~TRINITY_DN108969_c0_g1_i1.p1  ORF type:complete len:112 (-),score=15.63 TRINITY_DN108969_c0_g1_i1:38-334(-)
MTTFLMRLAHGKIVMALEGGYNLESISASMAACVEAFLSEPSHQTHRPSVTAHPFHTSSLCRAAQHLAQWWPCLADVEIEVYVIATRSLEGRCTSWIP